MEYDSRYLGFVLRLPQVQDMMKWYLILLEHIDILCECLIGSSLLY